MRTFILALLITMTSQLGHASSPLIVNGLEALRAGNADRAMDLWLSNSLLKRSGKTDQITQQLISVRQLCGRLDDWSPLETRPFGPQTTELIYVLHFERCPIFARFMIYRRNNEESIVRFNINTAPEAILESP